jgi:hypothetical protein
VSNRTIRPQNTRRTVGAAGGSPHRKMVLSEKRSELTTVSVKPPAQFKLHEAHAGHAILRL